MAFFIKKDTKDSYTACLVFLPKQTGVYASDFLESVPFQKVFNCS